MTLECLSTETCYPQGSQVSARQKALHNAAREVMTISVRQYSLGAPRRLLWAIVNDPLNVCGERPLYGSIGRALWQSERSTAALLSGPRELVARALSVPRIRRATSCKLET